MKSKFTRNIITLLTGSTLAQAIPIAITPILTRIYTPSDFGVFAIFLAITTILGSIANGRYELALILPEKDEDAINVAAIGIFIAAAISMVLLVIVIFFNSSIVELMGVEGLGRWLYLIPFSVFFIGVFNVLNYLNTRFSLYKNIALANVKKSIILSISQVGLNGFFKTGGGLILGQFFSYLMCNYSLYKSINTTINIKEISIVEMTKMGKKYIDFPKYSAPAILANTLSYQLLNILISIFYSYSILGFYSLVQRVMGVPSMLVGNAVSQVYFQQANQDRIKLGNCLKIFQKTVLQLIVISLLIFIPAYFLIEQLFVLFFGQSWLVAGSYAKILIPFFAIRFVVTPVTVTNSIFEKQKISLIWQISLLFFSILTLISIHFWGYSFEEFLKIWVLVMILHYLVLLVILNFVAKGSK